MFKSWETIGFNGVNGFPRYFSKKEDAVRNAFFDQVRKRGMSVIMTDSPIHAMPGKDKKGHEMNCLVPNMVAVCPSYRGKFYQAEVQRIKNCVIKSKPDLVFFDIEAWYRSHMTAKKCSRCLEKQKASGLSMDEYTKRAASETVRDFTSAVAEGAKEAGIKVPPVGLYGMDPIRKDLSQPVLYWPYYEKYIGFAQPSLYVGERPVMVQERIRKIRKV